MSYVQSILDCDFYKYSHFIEEDIHSQLTLSGDKFFLIASKILSLTENPIKQKYKQIKLNGQMVMSCTYIYVLNRSSQGERRFEKDMNIK